MKNIQITQIEAECVIRHMDALRMQHLEDRKADFCEPCCECSHVQECKSGTWLENTRNLSQIAGIFINPVHPVQEKKDVGKLDETVNSICDWIQSALNSETVTEGNSERVEMTKALAALVSARGISKEEIIEIFTKELNDSLKLEGNFSYEF